MLQSEPEQKKNIRKQPAKVPSITAFMQQGIPVGGYLLLAMTLGFFTVCGTFSFLTLRYIPDIINNQIDLRNQAITTAFRSAIKKPLLLRDYLQVNQEAKATSKLPGVAYAAVINGKGVVVGGFFSELSRFDSHFAGKVKESGFPVDIFTANRLRQGKEEASATLSIGGQKIYDKVQAVSETGGEVHVGVYVSEVEEAIRHALISPLTISLSLLVLCLGIIMFFFLNRAITKPLEEVTSVVNRISLGEMDLNIVPSGPREIRELANAFKRMQQSIRYMIGRLGK
ncbi:MAG: HAMP domain-containing protein [Desulforhopalus sp.]|nr:HAMP domain-containing protein [Desulforhopalus sp.]